MRRFIRTIQTGRKNSATLTLSTFASFVMVASEGLLWSAKISDTQAARAMTPYSW